ncbi:claudin-34 isoform X1 [Talpa occidentalis]|uniref:claudin-34 isoform X1 n=1 Tax=Talpa occidentalis TaxID=50954 RepID=UPI00188F551C|nr:claudin-34 isoform X1 [Talpa occidentalis]
MKPFICKIIGIFLSYVTWILGIILARSHFWRMWELNSSSVHMVFIGLWEAFYYQTVNISGFMIDSPVHATINKSWVIPEEIRCGQDLILLANIVKSVVLVFGSVALLVNWISQDHYTNFLCLYYNLAAFFLFLSCLSTVGAVTWNFTVDFYGQTTLQFPHYFPIRREMVVRKHLPYALPLGIAAGLSSLLSTIMLFETRFVKPTVKVIPAREERSPLRMRGLSSGRLPLVFLSETPTSTQ